MADMPSDALTRAELDQVAEAIHRQEIGATFTVTPTGEVGESDRYAPDVAHSETDDVEIESEDWETMTDGMSGQYGYRGPVMHASETIGRAIAAHLIDQAEDFDAYACVAVEVLDCDDDCAEDCAGDHEPAGWIIVGHRRS